MSESRTAVEYNNRGNERRLRGDLTGALDDFSKAIELMPNLASAWNNRALVRKARGEFDMALADYDHAIALVPNFGQFHINRGELKRVKGDLAGALIDYDRAIELGLESFVAYNNRGLVKQSQKDHDGAMADFDKAIALKPDMPALYSNRSVSKKLKGDAAGAQADADRALELKPDSPEVCHARGVRKRSQCDWAGAIAHFNRAIELNPNFSAAYKDRAGARGAMGDKEGAIADLQRAQELEPGNAQLKELIRIFKKSAKREAGKSGASKSAQEARGIPATENTPAIRTDFSDERGWRSLRTMLQDESNDELPPIDLIDDKSLDGVSPESLRKRFGDDSPHNFALVVDQLAISQPDHPILVIDIIDDEGQSFRATLEALPIVVSNLLIANMDFEEFVAAADEDGVFRGIDA